MRVPFASEYGALDPAGLETYTAEWNPSQPSVPQTQSDLAPNPSLKREVTFLRQEETLPRGLSEGRRQGLWSGRLPAITGPAHRTDDARHATVADGSVEASHAAIFTNVPTPSP